MQTPVQAEAMLGDAIKRAEEVDVAFLDSQRLEGDFSETGAKRLASALEAMLPHFDLDGDAGKVQGELLEEGRLGPDLTRKLLYVVDAINDAVDDSVLSAEMECDLETIRDNFFAKSWRKRSCRIVWKSLIEICRKKSHRSNSRQFFLLNFWK